VLATVVAMAAGIALLALRKRSCPNQELDRNDDSKKSHPDLVGRRRAA
jgi:hypothetical protein